MNEWESEWESYLFLSPFFCFVSLISFSLRPLLSNKTHQHTHSHSHMMSGFFCTLLLSSVCSFFCYGEQSVRRVAAAVNSRETFGWLKDDIYFHIVNAILLLSGVWISRFIFRSIFLCFCFSFSIFTKTRVFFPVRINRAFGRKFEI